MDERCSDEDRKQGNIVLGLDFHCRQCADKVIKHLKGYHGVDHVGVDIEKKEVIVEGLEKKFHTDVELISPKQPRKEGNHGAETVVVYREKKVTVKGKKADPTKIAERLREKSGKDLELISAIPPKEPRKKPKIVKLLSLHCCEGFACAPSFKCCNRKMPSGVTVETKLAKVKGANAMETEKIVELVMEKEGKLENKENQNGEEEEEGQTNPHHRYWSREVLYAPQLCSEESDGCSIL